MNLNKLNSNRSVGTDYPPLDKVILLGGDERLDMTSAGKNKYHVEPSRFNDVFCRGSCTCSPFTQDGFNAAKSAYENRRTDGFTAIHNRQTQRIKDLINYKNRDEFHVFFAPSGSDLCFYQLLFANLIAPANNVLNIVTCREELGSGSILALQGKNFASRNQFGDDQKVGSLIADTHNIQTELLSARDVHGGINNHSTKIETLVRKYYESHTINANLVIGSKSGIENNVSVISQVPESVLWTVDLCQFRASKVLINGLLGMNCCVMITGSKFYQSPPFCAALLVPKSIIERFNHCDHGAIRPFARIFSKYDIPEELVEIRQQLPDYQNWGLAMRWEAALKEMELLSMLDTFKVNEAMSAWNAAVMKSIDESRFAEAMPDQKLTNKTIISFRIKTAKGTYLSYSELAKLYTELCSRDLEGLGPYRRVLFGQPVKYGDKSFIRVAIGARDVRRFVLDGFDGTNDARLIRLIDDFAGERY